VLSSLDESALGEFTDVEPEGHFMLMTTLLLLLLISILPERCTRARALHVQIEDLPCNRAVDLDSVIFGYVSTD
jgi:hypothetical protein